METILVPTGTVQIRDYGDEEGLTLDYRGSLPCLAGRDRALDSVAFDSRSLLTSYTLYSDGQEALKPRLQPSTFSRFMVGR